MNEATVWRSLNAALKPYGVLERREDRLQAGVPDVIYALRPCRALGADAIEGQIELKYLPEWPKRSTTHVRFRRHTRDQSEYARRWWAEGGRCWLFARIGRNHYVLIPGAYADHVRKGLTRHELELTATVNHIGKFPTELLLKVLTGPRPVLPSIIFS
jgi:hypothetical protein